MKKKLYNSPLVEEMAIKAMNVIMEGTSGPMPDPEHPGTGGAPIHRD